jgi:hypothetical protein
MGCDLVFGRECEEGLDEAVGAFAAEAAYPHRVQQATEALEAVAYGQVTFVAVFLVVYKPQWLVSEYP